LVKLLHLPLIFITFTVGITFSVVTAISGDTCTQVTVVNGYTSSTSPVKFGVPQGSVLGPLLFALFCNDLPDIAEGGEGEIHIYAGDTTIHVIIPIALLQKPEQIACIP